MDLVSVPGVAGPNLAPRITFSYAPVNMQSLADGVHVGREAGHAGHGHAHGAHGHGHGAHGHGAHGHSHAPPLTPGHQMPPGPPTLASHQPTPHAHQQPPPPPPPPSAPSHSQSHGQDHPSASATGSTLDAIESFIQQERANMIIPTPTNERPRIRGRMTPYAFFVQERREYYRQQGVPVQFTAFSKECSALWKVISEEEKQKYQKLAEEDRERYRREVMGDYGKGTSKGGSRRGRRKKEPGQPKRNMCAFLHFCCAKRPKLKQENPSLSVGSLAKQLSSAWKLMTPEQKKPYDLLAEKDKQRYEQQKQAYEAGYSAAILKTDVPGGSVGQPGMVMSAPRHRRRKKDPDMPRRNMSAFMFYSLEKRPGIKALNPDFGVGKLAQSLAKEWNVMPTTDRAPFSAMALKDKERYVAELKAYKKGLYTGQSPSVRQIASLIRGRPVAGSKGNEDQMEVMSAGVSDKIEGAGPAQSPSTDGDGEDHDLERLCEFYQ